MSDIQKPVPEEHESHAAHAVPALPPDAFGVREAIEEAGRCKNCANPRCREGCPIGNDIPEFVKAMYHGNFGEARDVIARRSSLPAICGRVCPHEMQCEGHCVLGIKGRPVAIGNLERFAADFAYEMRLPTEKLPQKTRGRVAIIGSGPAGLTVAGDLARAGFSATVYEALPEPGGVLLYGIPEFRLPKEIVRREVQNIEALGVHFECGRMAGVDFTVDDLFAQGYDAVFIGSGTASPRTLDIPGHDMDGIIQSSYLLRMITLFNSGEVQRDEVPLDIEDRVLVIGGGNVAMDAARSAVRMGAASVRVVYRGEPDSMTALKAEFDAAVADGVRMSYRSNPVAFVGEEGKLKGLRVDTPDGEHVLEADRVYLAIGSRPASRIVSTTEGIDVDETGYVVTCERPYGMTTRPAVFAGGDVVHRPATVVLAMKEAKRTAAGIMEYVDAVRLLAAVPKPRAR